MTIREKLIGAWTLVTFESTLPDGRVISTMGRNAQGSIVYSEDGVVSVNLARGDRPTDRDGARFHALGDEVVGPIARGYMAYAGPFEVYEDRAVARHHFDMCLDPALIGTLQERHIAFPGEDLLELSVKGAPGVENPSRLLWRRVRA